MLKALSDLCATSLYITLMSKLSYTINKSLPWSPCPHPKLSHLSWAGQADGADSCGFSPKFDTGPSEEVKISFFFTLTADNVTVRANNRYIGAGQGHKLPVTVKHTNYLYSEHCTVGTIFTDFNCAHYRICIEHEEWYPVLEVCDSQ